jgi:hypothetical protein
VGMGQPFTETGLPSPRRVRHVEIGLPFWRRAPALSSHSLGAKPTCNRMNLDTPGRLSVFPKDLLSAETTEFLRAKATVAREEEECCRRDSGGPAFGVSGAP